MIDGKALEPAAVWPHFFHLCRVPRASGQEAALRRQLQDWALAQGLGVAVDAVGNLILRKPAAPGYEHAPGVVLQAHLDMVCQKNAGCANDFSRDPITPCERDGWLVATETTLGADNGIGVALILAVLEDRTLAHGPLEALLTVDEECGMGGARALAGDAVQGRLMLNLDTEAWGEFYLGCAGGLDVDVERAATPEIVPPGGEAWEICLAGLRGGHSGVDIHEGRGNALKLLVRVLRELEGRWPLRLASLVGGTARNALPREAVARVWLLASVGEALAAGLATMQAELREELAGIDDGLTLAATPCALNALMPAAEQAVWLASLHVAPYGVRRMSPRLPGVVETSNNLGVVDLQPGGGRANFMVRALVDRSARVLADEIASLFALSGTTVRRSGEYPGWVPNPDSSLLATCQAVFRREFGVDSRVQVIHAGLECGIIGARYPGMDIVSFGPTIRGAHAPGEAVEIASVGQCWRLLQAILRALR